MAKIILIKEFEAVCSLDGLKDEAKHYKGSFTINDEPDVTIKNVSIQEYQVVPMFDKKAEEKLIAEITDGASGKTVQTEVHITNGETLDYDFNFLAYASGNAGEHHTILKVTIVLSDGDELWHLVITKRRNTNPGTEGDVMHPVKP